MEIGIDGMAPIQPSHELQTMRHPAPVQPAQHTTEEELEDASLSLAARRV